MGRRISHGRGWIGELREEGTCSSSSELYEVKINHFLVSHTLSKCEVIYVKPCKHYMTCLLHHRNYTLSIPQPVYQHNRLLLAMRSKQVDKIPHLRPDYEMAKKKFLSHERENPHETFLRS